MFLSVTSIRLKRLRNVKKKVTNVLEIRIVGVSGMKRKHSIILNAGEIDIVKPMTNVSQRIIQFLVKLN